MRQAVEQGDGFGRGRGAHQRRCLTADHLKGGPSFLAHRSFNGTRLKNSAFSLPTISLIADAVTFRIFSLASPMAMRIMADASADVSYKEITASLDAIRFGNLKGEVIQVSPDTINTIQGAPYYKVLIATPKGLLSSATAPGTSWCQASR